MRNGDDRLRGKVSAQCLTRAALDDANFISSILIGLRA